jgi:hypothetical protein
MAQYIVGQVRDGLDVCTVFYGHPGALAYPLTTLYVPALQALVLLEERLDRLGLNSDDTG